MPHPVAARTTSSSSAASAGRVTVLAEEDLGLAIERLRDRLQLSGRLDEVDQLDVGAAQRSHLSPLPLMRRIDRMQPEACREHPVEGGRRATPLDVSKDRRPGLVAGPPLDLSLQPV